jgi:hypothetical protein
MLGSLSRPRLSNCLRKVKYHSTSLADYWHGSLETFVSLENGLAIPMKAMFGCTQIHPNPRDLDSQASPKTSCRVLTGVALLPLATYGMLRLLLTATCTTVTQ